MDLSSDEALLSEVLPSLVQLKELSLAQVNMALHDNEVFSKNQHAQLTAESLFELWGIGPKQA